MVHVMRVLNSKPFIHWKKTRGQIHQDLAIPFGLSSPHGANPVFATWGGWYFFSKMFQGPWKDGWKDPFKFCSFEGCYMFFLDWKKEMVKPVVVFFKIYGSSRSEVQVRWCRRKVWICLNVSHDNLPIQKVGKLLFLFFLQRQSEAVITHHHHPCCRWLGDPKTKS